LEQETEWIEEAMWRVLNTTQKNIRICATSQRWCNTDMKEGSRMVVWDRRRRLNSEGNASANAVLQKSIRQPKRTMWSNY